MKEIRQLDTPCYIFEQEDFANNIRWFNKEIKLFFDKYKIGYSFKTNYYPYILKCALEEGCCAEVVSEKEYKLALDTGFEPVNIIYNGPVKTHNSFIYALENGSIVNIDSQREIDWLKELPHDKKYNIGIRVNFDLEKELPGQTLMGVEGGRFGFCDDNGSLANALSKISELNNVRINCLHMHVSSKSKSVNIYRHLVKRAIKIIRENSLDIDYLDVGGSFFGGADNGKAYKTYVSAVYDELANNNMEDIGVIVEPGASVIATSISYMVEVVDIKKTTKNTFVVTDGSRLHIDPFLVREKYSYQIVSDRNDIVDSQVICGFTCMEKDRFFKAENEKELSVGDRMVFDTVGSYTMCFNSDFISSKPVVYVKKENEYYKLMEKNH